MDVVWARAAPDRATTTSSWRRPRSEENSVEIVMPRIPRREAKMVEGMLQGKSMHRAALEAGYSPSTAAATIYRNGGGTAKRIKAAVAKRQQEALEKAGIHTDIIVGQLVEIAGASVGDVLEKDGS